jgi:hypothetical protein
MAFRFQKCIKILPGLQLNVSKTGISWTAGTRGASVTSRYGNLTGNVGLPGAGLSYRKRIDLPNAEVQSQDQSLKPANSGKPSWLPLLIVLVIGIVIGMSLR